MIYIIIAGIIELCKYVSQFAQSIKLNMLYLLLGILWANFNSYITRFQYIKKSKFKWNIYVA